MPQSTAEMNLRRLGLELPAVPVPVANYVGAVVAGDLLFLAGHVPMAAGKIAYPGKVGANVSVEEAYQAARLTGLNLLATTRRELGSLDKVKRVVKVLGMVNAAPGFLELPRVMNGFSDLVVDVFGTEIGRHARSAVGVSDLPLNAPVEIEMVLQVC
jgi:enamine deaminase RidA (YjgF/YER057c/UK114 family)